VEHSRFSLAGLKSLLLNRRSDDTAAPTDLAAPQLPRPELSGPESAELAKLALEAERLAQASAWSNCEGGGWQYPFDLGGGLVTRTYIPFQAKLHPWRRNILLNNLDRFAGKEYADLSVLDLGGCEGAMAAGLWERGVRDITLVESRRINVEKANFIARTKGYDFQIVEMDVVDFLKSTSKTYDIVLFMELLQLLPDPLGVSRLVAEHTLRTAVFDTAVALPSEFTIRNSHQYGAPTTDGLFLRNVVPESNTGGFGTLELWPTRGALELLLKHAGFARLTEATYGEDPYNWYSSGERAMLFALK
jgi:Methyltransferase domain